MLFVKLFKAQDLVPVFFADRHDGESIASAGQDHVVETLLSLDFGKRHGSLRLTNEFDVDEAPARIFLVAFRIEILRLFIELCRIGVGRTRNSCDANDARLLAARVIEKHLVADLHVVTHGIARLIVANTIPHLSAIALEIVDTVGIRFGLH